MMTSSWFKTFCDMHTEEENSIDVFLYRTLLCWAVYEHGLCQHYFISIFVLHASRVTAPFLR